MKGSKKDNSGGKPGRPAKTVLATVAMAIILAASIAAAQQIVKSGVITFNATGVQIVGGNLDLNNNKITNLPAPAALNDIATKAYVDSLVTGVTIPASNVTAGTFPAGAFIFTGNTTNDVFTVNGSALVINGTNTTLGINVTNVTFRIQLPLVTSAAGGIAFGTDVELYPSSSTVVALASGDSLNLVSGSLYIGQAETITPGRIFQALNGSYSTPSLSFASDSDIGVYRSASKEISISTPQGGKIIINGTRGIVTINGSTAPVGGAALNVNGSVNATGNVTFNSCTGCPVVASGVILLYTTSTPPSGYQYTNTSTTTGGTTYYYMRRT